MWEQLLRGLREIEEVERTAADFRARFARDAEARCDAMIADLAPGDPRLPAMRRVRRALRWLPVRKRAGGAG